MKSSVKVEMSEDGLNIRPKEKPTSWPVASVDNYADSTLKPDVAAFIPQRRDSFTKPCSVDNRGDRVVPGSDLDVPSEEILSSSAPPELEGMWTEVKRRHRVSAAADHAIAADITPKKSVFDEATGNDDKEELDFMFDEELPSLSGTGRTNNFTSEWSVVLYV